MLDPCVDNVACSRGLDDHSTKIVEGPADSCRVIRDKRARYCQAVAGGEVELVRLVLGLPDVRGVAHPPRVSRKNTAYQCRTCFLAAEGSDTLVHPVGCAGRPQSAIPDAGWCREWLSVAPQARFVVCAGTVRQRVLKWVVFGIQTVVLDLVCRKTSDNVVGGDIGLGADN